MKEFAKKDLKSRSNLMNCKVHLKHYFWRLKTVLDLCVCVDNEYSIFYLLKHEFNCFWHLKKSVCVLYIIFEGKMILDFCVYKLFEFQENIYRKFYRIANSNF